MGMKYTGSGGGGQFKASSNARCGLFIEYKLEMEFMVVFS